MHEIIIKNKPDILAIEKIYFQNNVKTAIDVAEVR
ncbi:MAG: crossover junction endodeoxyribonuclease RuvC [Candidatus Peribacteria bacterium]|nr:crossover junction endodeoxyribonuclease RuvC [Candidatus Peribacteria bacterium]